AGRTVQVMKLRLKRQSDDPAVVSESALLIDESIAQADHRLDLAAGGEELGAKPADVDVDRPGLDDPVIAPDAFEQAVARHHPVLVLDQVAEQLELTPRQ